MDTREFNAALKQAALVSSRTLTQVVNGQALALAKRTIKATKRASKAEVQKELGQVGNRLAVNKDGKFRKTLSGKIGRRGAIYSNNSLAARIINATRKKRNEPLIFGAEMDKAVDKLVRKRVRSIAFLALGWVWSILDIAPKVGLVDQRRAPRPGRRPKGQRRGSGRAALPGRKPAAQIINTSAAAHNRGNPTPVMAAGLREGVRISVIDMKRHAEKRLAKQLKKFNGRR